MVVRSGYGWNFFFSRFKATINFDGEELLDAEALISTRFVYPAEAGCVYLLFCHKLIECSCCLNVGYWLILHRTC